MEASAPARPAWLPPIEARPDGTPLTGQRRRRPTPAAIAGVALLAMLVAGILVLRGPAAATTPASVARKFVEARAHGDSAMACRQLTVRARRDMVALLRGAPSTSASAGDCERYVLSTSERSEFTDPALPEFRGRKMVVSYFPNRQGAVVHARGLGDDPFLEARPVAGGWKLDGLASERASFIAGCTDHGGGEANCSCVFDRMSQRGQRAPTAMAAAGCRGYSGRSQPK